MKAHAGGTHRRAFQLPAAERRHRHERGEMLRQEPRLGTARADIDELDGRSSERGERHRQAGELPATLAKGAIDGFHGSAPRSARSSRMSRASSTA